MGAPKPSIVHCNIRGLVKNYYNLLSFLNTNHPDIVCLQETMLGPNSHLPYNRKIEFNNYNIYRKDCSPGKWGVAILVLKTIPQSLLPINSSLEQISVKVFFKGKDTSITSLYLPNQIPFNDNELDILQKSLTFIFNILN